MASEHLSPEDIPEDKLSKSNELYRKRRVSIKSSRVQRHSNAGICIAATRQRRVSTQRGTQRKRSLHHLFNYAPPTIIEGETTTSDKENSKVTNVVMTSRRLSLAVSKRPTFTAVEPSTGRRRSEPYLTNMFTTALLNTKRNSKSGTTHGRKIHGGRKFSTAEALMMKNNRKLEALAQDELLTCLNVPLPSDTNDFSRIEEQNEVPDNSYVIIDGDYISDEENERRIQERKRREEKRKCIIQELIDTEQNYITCLDIVIDVFKKPLESRNIVTPKDLKLMFPISLNDILNAHCRFMDDLDIKLKNDHWEIGDCFEQMTSVSRNLLDIYTRYVQSFPKSISTLTKYTRGSNKFRKFLDTCYHNPIVERLDLPSFLLSPVQRLPRYILLLSELYKYTDSGHPDKELINVTIKEMERIISSLDTSIKVSMESYNSSDRKGGGGGGFRKHFQSTRKKKRTLSSVSTDSEKKNIDKKASTTNSTCSSTDQFSPVRKSSNRSAPETLCSPTPPRRSPIQRRRTFDGYRDNGPTLSVDIKRDRNNSWRKSLGSKLANFFQADKCNGNCNTIENNTIPHSPHLALGTPI